MYLNILCLALHQLPVPLEGLGKILLMAELISKPSGIDHCLLAFLLGQMSLAAHLIELALH